MGAKFLAVWVGYLDTIYPQPVRVCHKKGRVSRLDPNSAYAYQKKA
jgi:hypothetical protein